MKILVTGAAGFIGSAVYRHLRDLTGHAVVALDNLSYAAVFRDFASDPRGLTRFVEADIGDRAALDRVFATDRPDAVINLAAESHVDRSIDGPAAFVATNVVGTFTLLEAVRAHWSRLDRPARERFRYLQVSTDEVFGALGPEGAFTEASPLAPNSPYSATKAGADLLVRAWGKTYGLPVLVTRCSNNYGPYQFPEKLIPLTILNALAGKPLPVYGAGENVRDWIHVEDHAAALVRVLERGVPGATYNLGADEERKNIDIVRMICRILDEKAPDAAGPRERLIRFVTDRPGHDFRYAIDPTTAARELGWSATTRFAEGLHRTVAWYLANEAWWAPIRDRVYPGQRLGTAPEATM